MRSIGGVYMGDLKSDDSDDNGYQFPKPLKNLVHYRDFRNLYSKSSLSSLIGHDQVEGEHGEHFNIPHVRELIFDVLNVIEQQNISKKGESPMETEQLTEEIITLVRTVDPNLSRMVTVETLRKTMTNRDFLSRLEKLTEKR
jgi:hypothetical protein